MNKAVFLQRVKSRASELQFKSERALCLAAGVSPDTIRHVRADRVNTLGGDTLWKLADALKVSIDWLIGKTADAAYRAADKLGDFQYVMVIGELQADTWRKAVQWDGEEHYPIPVPTDQRFPSAPRFALEVAGNAMNELYPDGSIVFCVRFEDVGRAPKHGDKVIVASHRHGFVEATCKEFIKKPDGSVWLHPRSTSPKHKPIKVPASAMVPRNVPGSLPAIVNAGALAAGPDDADGVQIVALITGCYIQQ